MSEGQAMGIARGAEITYRSLGEGPPILQIHGVGGARVTELPQRAEAVLAPWRATC